MKRIYCSFICFFLFLFNISYSNADDNIMMDEIVVTAARDQDSIYKIPANVIVITEQEIKKSCKTTVPDILEQYAGIHFRSYSGNASQSQIDLRGFGGDNPFGKTLILLNGKRLNRPDMSSINWLQLPIEKIEKIEVVKGGACVLYGDSAIAGVINIITKKRERNLENFFSVMIGSYDAYMGKAGITGSVENLFFSADVENYNTDGWRDRSAFSLDSGGLNLSYDFEQFTAYTDISYSKIEYELPGSLTKSELYENPRQFQPARPERFTKAHSEDSTISESINFDAAIEKITEKYGDIELKLVYNYNLITSDMISSLAPNRFNKSKINTFGILPKYVLNRNIFGFTNRFIMGFDFYNTTLFQNKYADKQRTIKTHKVEIEKESLGWYFKNDLNIGEDIILGLGFRNEKATINGEEVMLSSNLQIFNDKTSHYSNIFDISATKLLGAKTKFFGKFSTLYRYPFIDEQVYYNGNNGDKFLTKLKPEKGKSYEIGVFYSPFQKFSTGITLFNIDMEDEIVYDGIFPDGENKNVDETNHKGIEFSLTYNINEKFKFYSNWTYHKATSENGENAGKELPMVPKHKASVRIEIKLPDNIYITPKVF